MLARFQVELDHRVISVAQVPGAIAGSRGRLICDRLELTTGRDGSSAAVHLLLEDKVFIGKAKCDLTTTGRLRSIALATVDALNQLPAALSRWRKFAPPHWANTRPCWWDCF